MAVASEPEARSGPAVGLGLLQAAVARMAAAMPRSAAVILMSFLPVRILEARAATCATVGRTLLGSSHGQKGRACTRSSPILGTAPHPPSLILLNATGAASGQTSCCDGPPCPSFHVRRRLFRRDAEPVRPGRQQELQARG